MPVLTIWLAVAALLAMPVSHALAAPAGRIALVLDDCLELPAHEIETLVGIELGAVARDRTQQLLAQLKVSVGCRGDTAEVRVDDAITDKALLRTVRLRRADPTARTRLLALAIVELIVASWTELTATPAADSMTAPPAQAETAAARTAAQAIVTTRRPVAVVVHENALTLAVVGGYARMGEDFQDASGLGLRLVVDRQNLLGFSVEARSDRAAARVDQGLISLESASLSAVFLLHHGWGAFMFRGGAGFRGGLGALSGTSEDPRFDGAAFSSAWGAAVGLLSAGWRFGDHLCLDLSLDGGLVTSPLGGRVGTKRAIALDGILVGASLSVGWRL